MKIEKGSIFISLLSNLFHYYSFSVYAFSAVLLSPIFFHTETAQLTKIIGLVTFSVPFLIKPLGSVIFGHIGDKYGRKTALTYSLVAITLATTCIGLIPPYTHIGWLSSLLLLLCLLVQGLCIGGQYTGALVYMQEHTKKELAGFMCGVVGAIGVFGTLVGTLMSYIFHHFRGVEGWEWRAPFWISFIMGSLLYFFMKRIKETPLFIENKINTKEKDVPLVGVIRNYKRPLFSAIFISSLAISMFYLATVYIPNFYMNQTTTAPLFNPLTLVGLTQIFCIVLMPLLGFMGDTFGRREQLILTSLLLIITPIGIFYCMTLFNTVTTLVGGIFIFSLYASLYAGTGPAYLSEHFPVIGRYSGMGLGITIGEGVFGGLTPLICVTFEQLFDSKIAPAYFVMFLGFLSFVGILLSNKTSFLTRRLS